jgi:ribosomal-protein-alanine acetyltransferase
VTVTALTLRPATAAVVAEVAAAERALFGVDAWSAGSVAEELTGERRHAVVATDETGSVVGYAVALVAADVADLQRIAVLPPWRRTGLARRLLAEVQRGARTAGAERMLLEVGAGNEPARGFYAATGFVPIDVRPRYYRDGTDALVLSAPLGGPVEEGRGP